MGTINNISFAAISAFAAVAFVATRVSVIKSFRSLLTASISINKDYWFSEIQQEITSVSSNTVDEDWSTWSKPTIYRPADNLRLPFTNIADNTEGIAAFSDLNVPANCRVWLDIGGGRSDSCKKFMESRHKELSFIVMDPFGRSIEHNKIAQNLVELNGGADVVSSMSVLNVIPDQKNRLLHCAIVHTALKSGGIAYFKVWAGSWPKRGSSLEEIDSSRKVFQANKWASEFVTEVATIFGASNVFADNNLNLIVAMKYER